MNIKKPNLQYIPEELKRYDQWVLWKLKERGGKQSKIPYQITRELAQIDDPKTWNSFEKVVEAYGKGKFKGIGFIFSKDDPFTGIDFDKVVNPATLEISPGILEVISALSSYTEYSQSRTGIHVIVSARLPPGGRRNGNIEMYNEGRFFVMTGDHFQGTPEIVEERQTEIDELHQKRFHKPVKKDSSDTQARNPRRPAPRFSTDEEVIQKALKAENGAKFRKLNNGDFSGYESRSEADLAFCNMLAYWTNNDQTQMDRIFRGSGLFRSKWDEPHYSGGETYGQHTINKAIKENSKGTVMPKFKKSQSAKKSAKKLPTIKVGNR